MTTTLQLVDSPIKYTKYGNDHTLVTGFPTLEEAQARLDDLRSTYEHSYGFHAILCHPSTEQATKFIAKEADGTFSFRYWRGSSCD